MIVKKYWQILKRKKNSIPDEVGRDVQSVVQLQRKCAQFENDLLTLATQVQKIRDETKRLLDMYAGEKSFEIEYKQNEVVNAWRSLQGLVDVRKRRLNDTGDLYKFFNQVRDLMLWMDGIIHQMKNDDKPRDVSGVELLINNHQSLLAETEARDENFTICLNLGLNLINRRHPRSAEVKDKCVQLCMQRERTRDQWDEREEHLALMFEVYQFARDAAVAEQWLIGQEPYLQNEDLGDTLDQVENLIKKHEAFEKSIIAQEDRFNALKRLTTLELKTQQQKVEPKVEKVSGLSQYLEDYKTLEEREYDQRRLQEQQEEEARRVQREFEEKQRSEKTDVPDSSKRLQESTIETSKSESAPEATSLEALLSRKHEWESVGRKASNRSWDKVYCVLNNKRFEYYKDQKQYKNHKTLESLDLNGATVEIAIDYKKRDFVFRIRLSNGGQYLFKAKDNDEMNSWVQRISQTTGQSNDSKTKSLPPPEKRTTTSSLIQGGPGTTGSLKKDYSKK